jgi:hypothetical protein
MNLALIRNNNPERPQNNLSALSFHDWSNLVAETAEIRQAAKLRQQAKELGDGFIAISSSKADVSIIQGYLNHALYTTDSRVVRMSMALDKIIDTLVEIENGVKPLDSILVRALMATTSKVKNNNLKRISIAENPLTKKAEVVYLDHSITTKAFSWCLRNWTRTKAFNSSNNSATTANCLKKLASHLDDNGRAYIGRLIVNKLNQKYPLIVANLCKAPTENSFQDLRIPSADKN